jgi:hypothetical protein
MKLMPNLYIEMDIVSLTKEKIKLSFAEIDFVSAIPSPLRHTV